MDDAEPGELYHARETGFKVYAKSTKIGNGVPYKLTAHVHRAEGRPAMPCENSQLWVPTVNSSEETRAIAAFGDF